MFMDWKFQYFQDISYSKIDHRFITGSIKISLDSFEEIDKLFLNFHMEMQMTWNGQNNLEKKKQIKNVYSLISIWTLKLMQLR